MKEKETTLEVVGSFIFIKSKLCNVHCNDERKKCQQIKRGGLWAAGRRRYSYVCFSLVLSSRPPTVQLQFLFSLRPRELHECNNIFYFVLFVVAPLSARSICQHFVCQSSCAIIASLLHYCIVIQREEKRNSLLSSFSLSPSFVAFHIIPFLSSRFHFVYLRDIFCANCEASLFIISLDSSVLGRLLWLWSGCGKNRMTGAHCTICLHVNGAADAHNSNSVVSQNGKGFCWRCTAVCCCLRQTIRHSESERSTRSLISYRQIVYLFFSLTLWQIRVSLRRRGGRP